jgi:rhodanese-related sulfurtransferase
VCTVVCCSFASAEQNQEFISSIAAKPVTGVNNCTGQTGSRKSGQVSTYIPYHTKQLNIQDIDYGCLADVHRVQAQWQQGSVLIADVRRAEAYRQYHIPGSINLPLHAVKYKTNFRNSNIVLVNKGLTQRFLLDTCAQLKNSGLKQVAVLEGGLKSWLDNGYPLSNGSGSIKEISDISPYEYVNASAENEWVFVDLDHASEKIRSLIPNARIIKLTDDFFAFKKSIHDAKTSRTANKMLKFVVVHNSGNNYQPQRELFLRHAIEDIFFYLAASRVCSAICNNSWPCWSVRERVFKFGWDVIVNHDESMERFYTDGCRHYGGCRLSGHKGWST